MVAQNLQNLMKNPKKITVDSLNENRKTVFILVYFDNILNQEKTRTAKFRAQI